MIAGGPSAVESAAHTVESAGRSFDDAADDIGHHRRAAGADWSGDASDAAGVALQALAGRLDVGGPGCRSLATVLFDYARELRAAQQEHEAQQAVADTALASLAGLAERSDLDTPTSTVANLSRSAAAAQTAMSDAVERAHRADEDAAGRVDALVASLAGMGGTAVGPVVLGPPSGAGDGSPAGPTPPRSTSVAPPASSDGWSLENLGHGVLDAAGFIPGAGAVFDGANAAWYAAEGNYVDAAFSAAAMVPGAGDALAAARLGTKGVKAAEAAIDAEKAARAAEAAQIARTVAPTNVLPSTGKTWVATGRDTVYDVPAGWTQRMADNDKGMVFQRPGSVDDRDMVRIMEPTQRYPDGYVRVHNGDNQPVTPRGNPEGRAATHVPQSYRGPFPAWPTR